MTLEEIWQQAQKDKSNSFFIGNDSLFTIQNGCKIERFNDGTIIIKNTRLGGDFYKGLTDSEYMVFLADGWHKGTQYVELQTYKHQVQTLNRIIQHRLASEQDATKFQEKRTLLLRKIHENPYTKPNSTGGEADIVLLPSADA